MLSTSRAATSAPPASYKPSQALYVDLPTRLRERFLSIHEVINVTSQSKSTIHKHVREGRFPKPVPMLGRRVAWLESEVLQWMNDLIEERNRKAAHNA
ncbi:hypothetical protein AGMMS49545_18120 [Betaproteobacteria bacterium]|nr:hypothetical protein AGMMS49545_18120 [Betaproteobacteria bacterium]GHU45182.1 hypothetical protein AGMMS50289_15710 [Betaproteobacteria bacterium]